MPAHSGPQDRDRDQTRGEEHPMQTGSIDNKWLTLAAAGTAVFMLLLDLTIVNVALPDIQKDLHGSISDLQWVIDAYAISLGALLLTAGSLADLLGRKVVFATG